MVASTPQPPSGGMVGKKELLQWASQASGRIVTKFDELKDGDVLLRCMKETWPAAYDRCRRKGQPRSVSGNFELMGNMFEHLELPKSVLDTREIQHASFKSCYNFLVMAFFLKNLATHSDFSVDFTHPVDSKLAAFLQAPESVASLHKGGALAPPEEEAPRPKRREEERRPRPDPAATHPESGRPPPAATATTRWSRRPPRRSGPRPRSRTRRPTAAPCSPPRPRPRGVEGGMHPAGESTRLAHRPGCRRRPLGTKPGTTRTPRRAPPRGAPPSSPEVRGPRCSRRGTRAGSRRAHSWRRQPTISPATTRRRRGAFAASTRSSAAAGIEPRTIKPARRPAAAARGSTGRRRSTARATGTWLRVVPTRRTRRGGAV